MADKKRSLLNKLTVVYDENKSLKGASTYSNATAKEHKNSKGKGSK
jgi:hypothetical protein